MFGDPWSALQVKTNQEKRVSQHLAIRSVEHYLPLYNERSRWSDRTVTLERPLFPGYLFVRLSPENRLPIVSAPGVLRVLGNGEADLVTPEEVERIRVALASGYSLRPHANIRLGTGVRVRKGVFAGVIGIVTEIRRKCSVVISLSNSLQSFCVETDFEAIDVLDDVMVGLDSRYQPDSLPDRKFIPTWPRPVR